MSVLFSALPTAAVTSVGAPWMWGAFTLLIVFFLALDLGVLNRKPHAVGLKEALGWTAFWVSLALLFNVFVAWAFGRQAALEFLTGYVIEEALSIDNIFVFVVVFSFFAVPPSLQHRVLFWGIIGAFFMRLAFILVGTALLEAFSWVIYVFGAFLVVTALRLGLHEETEIHPDRNPLLRLIRRFVPVTADYEGTHFLVRRSGRWFATPLLMVLIVIEGTDLVFAVDSIPAIFAVTRDPFIVFTSNIFAILGLRSLYFLLASVIHRFHYLRYGLALVLGFVGVKMLLSGYWHVPIGLSLGIVVGLLGGSVLLSLLVPPRDKS